MSTVLDASMPLRFNVTLTRPLPNMQPSVLKFEELLSVWNVEQGRMMTEPEFREQTMEPFLDKLHYDYPGWESHVICAEGLVGDHLTPQ